MSKSSPGRSYRLQVIPTGVKVYGLQENDPPWSSHQEGSTVGLHGTGVLFNQTITFRIGRWRKGERWVTGRERGR